MGRPSKGNRRQVNVRLPVDLVARLDLQRGPISRDEWFERAASLALRPASVMLEPELKQESHIHVRGKPLRTEYASGQRKRYFECSTCGVEMWD